MDALDRAQRLYERGQINGAAELIRVERNRADAAADLERTAEIDDLVEQMRGYLDGDELASFNRRLRGETDTDSSDALQGVGRYDEELSEEGEVSGASESYGRQVGRGLLESFLFDTEAGWVVLGVVLVAGIVVAAPAWWAISALTGDGYLAFLAAILFVYGPWLISRFVPSGVPPWASTLGAVAIFIGMWGATGNSKISCTAGAIVVFCGPFLAVVRQQRQRR